MLENITKKKTYLVYQVGTCEMGSEGWSSRYFPCVAQGNTKEEVVNNWVENVKTLYGQTINPKYDSKSDSYYDYYGIGLSLIHSPLQAFVYAIWLSCTDNYSLCTFSRSVFSIFSIISNYIFIF